MLNNLTEAEQQLLDLLAHYSSQLTEWEERFIEDMQQEVEDYTASFLTDKQKTKIAEIFERCDSKEE